MCRDLFDAEAGIRQCEEYGTNGQSQRGIDLIACRNDDGLELGQCKCEREFPPAKIRAASDEFLEYWDFWRERNVTRFIVFVASEVKQTQRQEEIQRQKTHFQSLGITYELWPATKIANKLRPYRGIVATHLGPEWATYLCGPSDDPAIRTQLAAQSALNERLVSVVADVTDERIIRVKDLWQCGRRTEAKALLDRMKNDQVVWQAFPQETQGSVLRLEASIILEANLDITAAQCLLSEAMRLSPSGEDHRIRASILWARGKHFEAIEELAKYDNPRARTQAALMLAALGRVAEAEKALSAIDEQTAESFRVEALVHLCAKRMPEARTAILKAREKAASNLNIRYSEAVINYWSAVAQIAVPSSLVAWPEPTRWTYVLRDDESNTRIRSSAEAFREMLMKMEANKEERQLLETWYIAALANNPSNQDFAEHEIGRLLSADPTNHRLLVWAVARFPQRTFPEAVDASRSALIDGGNDPEKALALAYYFIANRKPQRASKLLSKYRPLFEGAGALTIWAGLMAQVTAMTEGLVRAGKVLQSHTVPELEAKRIEASVLRFASDPQARLHMHLEESYRLTGDPRFLLELVEWQAERGNWVDAVQWCERLAAEIKSAEVTWLAVVVSHRAQRADLCLQLINEGQTLFPRSRLPSELRRIRIDAQRRLGLVPVAIQEAEYLAHEEPSLDNLLTLSQLYFSVGDQRRTCVVAEQILELDSHAPASVYLRLAWQSQWEDTQLAVRLWRRAAAAGFAVGDVVSALNLGHSLGLEDQLNELTRRMMDLGATGMEGVQLATLDDLKRYAQAFRDNAEQIIMRYERGEIPVHVVAQRLNLTLADIFHEYPEKSRKAAFGWAAPVVLSRSGRRPVSIKTGTASWIVTADVTSLLLAQHFGYLDCVEQAFAPLQISPALIPSLVAMQDHLTASQPARIDGFKAILQALSDGKISAISKDVNTVASDLPDALCGDWAELYEAATRTAGYLVDFVPIVTENGTIPLSELPSEVQCRVIGQKAILRSMSEYGPLTQSEYGTFLDRLGSINAEPDDVVPAPDSSLYFHGTCIESLASVGLLSRICERFRVFMERSEIDRLEDELREYERRWKLAGWIKGLVERLGAGIRSGIYAVLPATGPEGVGEPPDLAKLDVIALREVLTARATENHRLWSDDRWMNGHQRAGSMEIVDSVSILEALRQRGRISSLDFYDVLGRMRAEGVCFIPLTADEVLGCLADAHVRDNRLVETSRLQNLRRGMATTFLHSNLLQRGNPNVQSGEPGELACLIQSMRACVDSLKDLWGVYENETEVLARARWILESLHIDFAALRRIAGLPSTEADDLYIAAVAVAGLLSRTISMQANDQGREAARKYINWIFGSLVTPRMYFEPEFVAKIGLATRQILFGGFPQTFGDPLSRASAALLYRLFLDLPPTLQSEITSDLDFATKIGLKVTAVAKVGELRFEQSEYLAAAKEAINGRSAIARTMDQEIAVRFMPTNTRPGAIELQHPSSDKNILIDDPVLGLLLESIEEREIAARRFAGQLDVPPAELATTAADLVSIEDTTKRIQKAEALRSKSLAFFVSNLRSRIRNRDELKDNDLLPGEPDALSRFLRMLPDQSVDLRHWVALRAEGSEGESISQNLHRLFSLPVELPPELESQVLALGPDVQRDLMRSSLRQARTPLFAIHLARILAVLGSKNKVYRRLANRLVIRLLRSMDSEVRAYLTVVKWAISKLSMWRGTEGWSPSFRLASAWLLGDQIFGSFRSEGVEAQSLIDIFSVTSSIAENIFVDSSIKHDVAHPTNADSEVFVACSLAYVFRGESVGCIADQVRQEVSSLMLLRNNSHTFPALPLLPNPATATNLLASFLGCDRIAALLDTIHPDARLALQQSLQQPPWEQARVVLESCGLRGWLTLSAVLGGFPPPSDLLPSIENAIATAEFQDVPEEDSRVAAIALCVATRLLVFTPKQELISRCRTQLIGMAKQMSIRSNSDDVSTNTPVLLESALNISRTQEATLDRISDFAMLIAQIAIEWPRFGEEARPIIQRLCEELPTTQTVELWRLTLRLRTR
jgi:tetratricopeptide (TPR) repeat protein